LLPPKIEDESLRDALRIFSNPSSAFYSRMLDALFNTALQFSSAASFANAIESQRSVLNPLADPMQQSTLSWAVSPQLLQSALVSHTSRANTTDGDNIMNHELLASRCVDIVTATLKSVFAKHSASVLNTPTLTPPLSAVASSSDAGSSSTNASASKPNTDGVMLLDRSGAPVAMRTDLRVGFVRHCACRPWLTIRRYELGTVFRSTGSVEMMKEVLQSDFDMVHFDAVPAVSVASVADKPSTLRSRGSSNALAELPKLSQQAAARACYDAELIVVASEVLQALSPLLSSTSAASAIRLRIGHSNLLSAVLSACSVPPQHLSLVHNVLASQITMASHLNQQQQIAQHWTSIRAALSQTLTSNSLDRMSDFFMVRFTHGGIQHAVTVLKDMLHCEAMMELVLIAELVELMGATIQLQLDPLLCLPAKIAGQYSGLVIKGESAMETLLVGGRYTAYLNDAIKQVTAHGSMVAKDQTYNRGAVGMSFAVEKLSAAILRQQSNSLLSLSTFAVPSASALVFVASVGADAWTERLRIVGELWRENVRASFITDDSISLAEQVLPRSAWN
jgi:histidyl-tRNA synthetase